jgi:hypothetical protein
LYQRGLSFVEAIAALIAFAPGAAGTSDAGEAVALRSGIAEECTAVAAVAVVVIVLRKSWRILWKSWLESTSHQRLDSPLDPTTSCR